MKIPSKGFTLIEIVVAVVIVAILAGIAFPSFTKQAAKARRSDAFAAITAVQLAQQKFRANCPTYSSSFSGTPCTGLNLSSSSPEGYYSLALSGVSATGYTVTATPVSGGKQAGDTDCTSIAYTLSGLDETKTPSGTQCWPR